MRLKAAWSLLPVLLVAVGCISSGATESPARSVPPSTAAAPSSSVAPPAPPTPEEAAARAAMEAYEGFWSVRNEADRAPGARDWAPAISRYTADPARYFAIENINAYAEASVHAVGEPEHSPRIESVSLEQPPRVVIIDCIDFTGTDVVRDDTGESVADPAQPPRSQLRAVLVLYPDPDRWLVQETESLLEQSC